jgi:hypothetical protein
MSNQQVTVSPVNSAHLNCPRTHKTRRKMAFKPVWKGDDDLGILSHILSCLIFEHVAHRPLY